MTSRGPRLPVHTSVLTQRQQEVLALVADGKTNFEVAQALGISLETAKYHVSEILARLDVESREDAAAIWRADRTLPARMRRHLRALLPLGGSQWGMAIAGIAAVVVAGLLVVALVTGSGGDDREIPASDAAAATTSPSPTASIAGTATANVSGGTSTAIVIPGDVYAASNYEFLDVLANGKECGILYFRSPGVLDASGDAVFSLDLATQFPDCSTQGAKLMLVTDTGFVLRSQPTVEAGQRMEIPNLDREPFPPDVFPHLTVNRGVLAYTDRSTIQRLEVRANDVLCGEIDLWNPALVDSDGNATLALGGPSGVAACSFGWRLSVRDNNGNELFRHPVVPAAARIMLAALGPEPPATVTGALPTATPVAIAWAPASTVVDPYPLGTRTGIDAIDRFLDAVESGDLPAVKETFSYHPERCYTQELGSVGTPGSLRCPPGVAANTELPVVWSECTDGCRYLKEDVEAMGLGSQFLAPEMPDARVYAVVDLERLPQEYRPSEYMVIFANGEAVHLDDIGPVLFRCPCQRQPWEQAQINIYFTPEFILPPR